MTTIVDRQLIGKLTAKLQDAPEMVVCFQDLLLEWNAFRGKFAGYQTGSTVDDETTLYVLFLNGRRIIRLMYSQLHPDCRAMLPTPPLRPCPACHDRRVSLALTHQPCRTKRPPKGAVVQYSGHCLSCGREGKQYPGLYEKPSGNAARRYAIEAWNLG